MMCNTNSSPRISILWFAEGVKRCCVWCLAGVPGVQEWEREDAAVSQEPAAAGVQLLERAGAPRRTPHLRAALLPAESESKPQQSSLWGSAGDHVCNVCGVVMETLFTELRTHQSLLIITHSSAHQFSHVACPYIASTIKLSVKCHGLAEAFWMSSDLQSLFVLFLAARDHDWMGQLLVRVQTIHNTAD